MTNTTHFGFKRVDTHEKSSLVGDVFRTVAPKYDIMNDVMSMGVHRLWKKTFLAMLNPTTQGQLLDVAGGTGDIALAFLKHAPAGHVTVCDINPAMLREGHAKVLDQGRVHGIDWVCGNAEQLPCPSSCYDYYTIAFGIRNVTHIDTALQEAYRVLKPGGRFLCLEFSHVGLPWLQRLYDVYSFELIPRFGKWIAGDAAPYQYLVESIRQFPKQTVFQHMIEDAGFSHVTYRNLTGGVVAIHSGWKV